MDGSPLDAVDRGIIYHLQDNASQPITDIADAVGVADNTVRNRIQNLEAEGVIEGYQANVNYDEAGVQHYYDFICTAPVNRREQLARDARQVPGVVEVVTLMTGRENVYILGAGSRKDDITEVAYDLDELGLGIDQEFLVRDHHRQPFEGFRVEENL